MRTHGGKGSAPALLSLSLCLCPFPSLSLSPPLSSPRQSGPRPRRTELPAAATRPAGRPLGPSEGLDVGRARARLRRSPNVRRTHGPGPTAPRNCTTPSAARRPRPGRLPRARGHPTLLSPPEGGGGFNVSPAERRGALAGYGLSDRNPGNSRLKFGQKDVEKKPNLDNS